jgi:hypothetical protein
MNIESNDALFRFQFESRNRDQQALALAGRTRREYHERAKRSSKPP